MVFVWNVPEAPLRGIIYWRFGNIICYYYLNAFMGIFLFIMITLSRGICLKRSGSTTIWYVMLTFLHGYMLSHFRIMLQSDIRYEYCGKIAQCLYRMVVQHHHAPLVANVSVKLLLDLFCLIFFKNSYQAAVWYVPSNNISPMYYSVSASIYATTIYKLELLHPNINPKQ